MAEEEKIISKITLDSGEEYDVSDANARQRLDALESGKVLTAISTPTADIIVNPETTEVIKSIAISIEDETLIIDTEKVAVLSNITAFNKFETEAAPVLFGEGDINVEEKTEIDILDVKL